MFQWLKKRLVAWVDDLQQREIARLKEESKRLKEEIARTTGEPVQLTPEQRQQLREKAKGIDPETLKDISAFGPEVLNLSDHDSGSAEN